MGETRDAITERHLQQSAQQLTRDLERTDARSPLERLADSRAKHNARLNPEPAQPEGEHNA